jgi:hypothetical protein
MVYSTIAIPDDSLVYQGSGDPNWTSDVYSIVPPASMKNQAKPLVTVTNAAKSKAVPQPSLVAIRAVTTGEAAPPRLPKVAMIPEIEPDHFVDMSVHVV